MCSETSTPYRTFAMKPTTIMIIHMNTTTRFDDIVLLLESLSRLAKNPFMPDLCECACGCPTGLGYRNRVVETWLMW